jgi:hypothetical protein
LNPCTSDSPEPRKALLTFASLRDNHEKFHGFMLGAARPGSFKGEGK